MRRLQIVLGALLLLVLLAPTLLSLGFLRSTVQAQLSEQLTGEAAVEDASFGWLSGLEVTGVRVDNPPGFADERPALTMQRLAADVSLLSLLFGTLDARGEIVGLEVFVEQRADGSTNLQQLTEAADAAGADAPPADDEGNDAGGAFALDFHLRDCAVTIRREGELLEALTELRCHARSASDSDDIEVEAAGKLRAGDLSALLRIDPAAQTTDAKLVTHGLDLSAWEPLVQSFAPDQLTALAGLVDGEVTAKLHAGDQVELAGELSVQNPRVAGPIVQGMDLRATQWKITPAIALGAGASSQVDASGFGVDLEWLHVRGEPTGADGEVALSYDLDIAQLAEFGGPIPEMLKGSGSKLTGRLQVPTAALPTDAAGWAQAILASADLQVAALDVAGFAVRDLGVDLDLDAGKASLSTTPTTRLDGGALVASVAVDLNDFDTMPLTASLKWDGGKLTGGSAQTLRYLVPMLSRVDAGLAEALGDVEVDLNFAGPALRGDGQSWLAWLDEWSGDGALGLSNTSFKPAEALAGLLQPLGPLSAGVAPVAKDGELKLDAFSAPFSFAKGLIQTKGGQWIAGGKKIGLEGSVSFAGEVDYVMDFASMLRGHKDGERVLQALGGKLQGARLGGTLDAPQLGLPKLGDIATKLLQEQGKQLLEGGLEKGLKGLFGRKKD